MVQLREKDAGGREFYEIGLEIRRITADYGVPLVIDDRLDLALALGADGVHLGQSDLPLSAARRVAGNKLFIGISAGSVEEALAAEQGGADYIGVSPLFLTATKPDARSSGSSKDSPRGLGLEGLRAIRAAVHIPLVAIGGVKPENAGAVLEAGADGLAVVSGILSQSDVKAAAENYISIIKNQISKTRDKI
jgi:thiamine-phosphate pyrophosphorylase